MLWEIIFVYFEPQKSPDIETYKIVQEEQSGLIFRDAEECWEEGWGESYSRLLKLNAPMAFDCRPVGCVTQCEPDKDKRGKS